MAIAPQSSSVQSSSSRSPVSHRARQRSSRKKVIIIGAGPGGLAAAMLLAASGVEVCIYERTAHIGGRTSSFTANGFRFDLGPTFFLFPRVLEDIFAATGHDLRAEIELLRLDPQYRLLFGQGGELLATPDPCEMARRVALLSPADGPAFARFLADNRRKFALFAPCLEASYTRLRDLFSLDLLRALPALAPWRTLNGDLSRYFRDERIRLAFTFQSKYLGMSPFQCPSLFSILSYLEYEYGVFHPRGGCGAVSEAMANIARKLGVKIYLERPVEQMVFEGRKAVGVRTAEGVERADAVVMNADFARGMQRLAPDTLRRRWTDKKLAKKRYSCSTFMMYLGLEGVQDEIPHHSIYLAADYARNLDDIGRRHVLSEDPSFYVQNATPVDRSLAPAGHSTLYVLAPVTHQHANVDWSRERGGYRDLLLRQLAKAGFRDIERRIRYERIITPNDWDQGFEIYRGATFNLTHNLGQMLYLRPRNRFEDLQSVYLVGGGTHPGSGLPVIYSSARITTRLLLEDLGLDTHLVSGPVMSFNPPRPIDPCSVGAMRESASRHDAATV